MPRYAYTSKNATSCGCKTRYDLFHLKNLCNKSLASPVTVILFSSIQSSNEDRIIVILNEEKI